MSDEVQVVDVSANLTPDFAENVSDDGYPDTVIEPEGEKSEAPVESTKEPEKPVEPAAEAGAEPEVAPAVAEAEKPEEKAAEKPPDEGSKDQVTPETAAEQIKAILEKLPEESRNEVLGTSNKAFAALTHKHQKLRAREEEYVRQYEALQKERQEIQKTQEGWNELLKIAKTNPVKALEALDWSYEDTTKFMLDGQVPDEKRQAFLEQAQREHAARVERERQELEQRKQELVHEQAKTKVQAHLISRTNEIARTVTTDKYPYIRRLMDNPQANVDAEAVARQAWQMELAEYQRTNGQTSLSLDESLGIIEKDLERHAQMLAPVQPTAPRTGGAPEAPKTEISGNSTLTADLTSERSVTPRVEAKGPSQELDPDEAFRRMLDDEEYDPHTARQEAEMAKLRAALKGPG